MISTSKTTLTLNDRRFLEGKDVERKVTERIDTK